MIFSVYYPHSAAGDNGVGWAYLHNIAKDRRNGGAVAVCTSRPGERYVLRNGEWAEATEAEVETALASRP